MKRAIVFCLTLAAMPAIGGELYRYADPETGKTTTSPVLPPYPVKAKATSGGMVNLTLDADSPQVKAAVEARKKREESERISEEKRRKQREEEASAKAVRSAADAIIAESERKKACGARGIRIGMSVGDFIKCKGSDPDDINTTTTRSGARRQLVYGTDGRREYYYFENGILTAIQD